jgi:GNAT superfamily N-acetyltransferase
MVRPATAQDVPAIERLVERAFAGYIARIGRRPAPMDDDYAARVLRGEAHVWDDGGVVGVIVIVLGSDHLLVDVVAVHPDRRGEGIGRALLRFAERRAIAHGLPELRLSTNEAMSENLVFYPRMGFSETGRRTTDTGYSRVFFRKSLKAG